MTLYVTLSRVYGPPVELPPSAATAFCPCPPPLGASMALTWIRPDSIGVETWRDAAACRSIDPDLFFPIGTTGTALDHIAAAKAVCTSCPVKAECLDFALETNQDSGVWGG